MYLDNNQNIELSAVKNNPDANTGSGSNGFDQKLEEIANGSDAPNQANNQMAEGGILENKGNFMNADATIQLDKTNLQYEGGQRELAEE